MATTVRAEFAGPDSAYWGDQDDWLIIAGKNRDSDALVRANFDAAVRMAADRGIECETMTASHWLVGHVSYAIVPPSDAARELAQSIEDSLADYPVLDDELWSEYEYQDVLDTLTMFAADLGRGRDYGYTIANPSTLAAYLYDALTERNGDASPYLESYPRTERGQSAAYDERPAIAAAIRAYRRDAALATATVQRD